MTAVPTQAARAAGTANGPRGRNRGTVRAALFWNPVLAKELRTHVRGTHAASLLTGYLCVIGAFGYLVYSDEIGPSADVIQVGSAGLELFRALAISTMATIALVVPGLVGPAVSGESEHQTLELLLVTPLKPARIVIGKLCAALAMVVLLVVACLPVFSVAFLLGGVSLHQLLEIVAFTLVAAFSLGSLSMLASVVVRSVSAATVVAYLGMLILTVGPFIGAYAWQRASSSPGSAPIVTTVYGETGGQGVLEAISPVAGAGALLSMGYCDAGGFVTPMLGMIATPVLTNCAPPGQYTTSLGPLGTWQTWQASLAFDGGIGIAAIAAAIVVLRRREVS